MLETTIYWDRIFETIAYCVVGTASSYLILTLLPLWVGFITNHPRKKRLILVPSIPFVVSAIFANVTIILSDIPVHIDPYHPEDILNDFWVSLLTGIAYTAGFSAFSLWIVTWALFKKWRNED